MHPGIYLSKFIDIPERNSLRIFFFVLFTYPLIFLRLSSSYSERFIVSNKSKDRWLMEGIDDLFLDIPVAEQFEEQLPSPLEGIDDLLRANGLDLVDHQLHEAISSAQSATTRSRADPPCHLYNY